MEKEYYANFRDARIVQVIKVEVNEGEGTTEDPISRVVYLLDFNGKVLVKIGPHDRERKFAGGDEMMPLTH